MVCCLMCCVCPPVSPPFFECFLCFLYWFIVVLVRRLSCSCYCCFGVLAEVLRACVACWQAAALHAPCHDIHEVVQVCRPTLLTSSHLKDWEKCARNSKGQYRWRRGRIGEPRSRPHLGLDKLPAVLPSFCAVFLDLASLCLHCVCGEGEMVIVLSLDGWWRP